MGKETPSFGLEEETSPSPDQLAVDLIESWDEFVPSGEKQLRETPLSSDPQDPLGTGLSESEHMIREDVLRNMTTELSDNLFMDVWNDIPRDLRPKVLEEVKAQGRNDVLDTLKKFGVEA